MSKSQNIYDNQTFFEGYKKLRSVFGKMKM